MAKNEIKRWSFYKQGQVISRRFGSLDEIDYFGLYLNASFWSLTRDEDYCLSKLDERGMLKMEHKNKTYWEIEADRVWRILLNLTTK